MKTKMTLALMAILTSTAFASFPAPLPEFKNEKQLAEWRAEMAAKDSVAPSTSDVQSSTPDVPSAFYTGRPYLALTGTYAFKYRSYNPELARWTSEDPSGFPDGANGNTYAPNPISDFDVAGLLKWNTLKNQNKQELWSQGGYDLKSDIWTVETNDGSAIITLKCNTVSATGTPIIDRDYTYNCHGYTFGDSKYWIDNKIEDILKGDGYKLINGENKTGAKIGYWGDDTHTARVNSVSSTGEVTKVTGKRGSIVGLTTSTPSEQNYPGTIKYYE